MLFIYLINFLLIIWFIIFENKNYRSSFKWILIFLLFPLIGFIIYLFIGRGMYINKKRYLEVEEKVDRLINYSLKKYSFSPNQQDLSLFLSCVKKLNGDILTYYNNVYYFANGNEYFSSLLFDIENAKYSINIEMYIFRSDDFSSLILDLLLKKANQGIKVKILYDPNGNLTNKFVFERKYKNKNLIFVKQNNILFQILNFNYRNHRKIIVIDGKISYFGGFNIGEEYLSKDNKVNPFRDTMIKVIGEEVLRIQRRFLIDFYYAYSQKHLFYKIDINDEDLIFEKVDKFLPLQLVSTSFFIRENIKRMKLKIMSSSKKEILIQTPYLILDQIMMDTLKMMALSNIKIKIMIPFKYDQKIPFYSTLGNAKELYNIGCEIYFYKGFIHSKSLIVDDYFLSLGSSNFDIRSFSLNMESDIFFYSYDEVSRFKNIFNQDLLSCIRYSPYVEEKYFAKFKKGKKLASLISSLM